MFDEEQGGNTDAVRLGKIGMWLFSASSWPRGVGIIFKPTLGYYNDALDSITGVV